MTSLVSPAVKDAEQEPNIDAPRPRREPRPSKKKLEDLENTQQCEELKRKKARKEPGEKDQNLKKPSSKQKQTDQEPEVSRKKKSVSKKRKVADPKDTQDRGFISAANTQRVQNLLERRQHVSWKPEVVEIEEGEEENRTNQPASSLQPKSKPQPSGIHLHVAQSAVPAEPVQINSEPQPRPINVVKSTDTVSNSRSQPADTFQQRDVPNLMHQLLADKQSNGSESTPFPPQQSSNLSIATRSPSSSHYKSASPVNPASRFQFSSTPLGSSHSALRGRPLPSHLSMSSPQQFINSSEVLSSPVIPQQEFSISQSLSHCSDYDVSDLEGPITYSPRNRNLHQLQTVRGHISRDDSWHSTSSFSADVNTSCPSCQPLLQSLSNRLSSLEAEVEKLRRKQRKVWKFIISVKDLFKGSLTDLFNPLLRKIYPHITLSFLTWKILFSKCQW